MKHTSLHHHRFAFTEDVRLLPIVEKSIHFQLCAQQ